jgi:hypothetical protein
LRKPLHNNFHSLNAILLPVIGYVLIPIIAPCGISIGMLLLMADKWSTDINAVFCKSILYSSTSADGDLVRSTFPAALIFLLALTSRRALSTRIGLFRQRLIDAEYVVEERVENYEPKLTGTAVSGDTVKQVESLVEVMDPDGSDTGDRADWEEDAVDLDVEGDESEGILSQAETEELG